jgi:hypothetical protein
MGVISQIRKRLWYDICTVIQCLLSGLWKKNNHSNEVIFQYEITSKKFHQRESFHQERSLTWVLIPEDNRHSTVTRKIPLFSVEPVTISYTHYWVHWFLPVKYFTCKNYLDWDIFRYFYFFTKYIELLSLYWISCTI